MKLFKIPLLFTLMAMIAFSCDSKTDQQQQVEQTADSLSLPEKRTYEAISLLGDTLYAAQLPEDVQQQYEAALKDAQKAFQQNPNKLNHIVQLGRRLTDLQRFQDAIKVYTEGMQNFPTAAALYRHRGQCYITIRKFSKAINDLEKSAELIKNSPITVETEGITPADNSSSTLQFNIYYHLGLAYYLSDKYGKAAQAYEKCLTYTQKDQETAAAADWLYMTYRRLGEDEIAEKTLDIIKDELGRHDQEGYFERIMMYKGMMEPEALLQTGDSMPSDYLNPLITTKTYGVGNYYMINGDEERGESLLRDVVDSHYWVGLGYIAAEADLARMQQQ